MSRVVVVVQARMSSTRLPGKVLAPLGRSTVIDRLLDQLAGARAVDQVVVATSTDSTDDLLVAHLDQRGVPVARGSIEDVLERYVDAARKYEADVVVRITGDCPLHAPDTVDEVVRGFLASGADYGCNHEPYSRPDGQDVEVMSRKALDWAAREATPGPDREHVTPLLRRAPAIRRYYHRHAGGANGGQLRWTVDEPADLEYARAVWARLDCLGRGPHSYETIMKVALEIGTNSTDMANRGYYRSLFDTATGEKATPLTLKESEKWLARSSEVIPGGAQTYSKSWRQHIRGVSPIFLDRGKGAWVWDVDGNRYVDLVQGLLPNILGYARPEVDQAAYDRARRGHNFSLANSLEVELAERLRRIIPCAEMVRFGKNGSDATAGAVRIARAFTGRDRIAMCGYHGWHDWCIGTTSRNTGVPPAVRELTDLFPYNDLDALERVLLSHAGEYAAVIMEPFNFVFPDEGYLEGVKGLARRHGAVLIFDEICTGFHFGLGGAQKMFGVSPDLAAFGKAMGNGYPISCVVGRRDVMKSFEDAFVSFTFAGDVSAMAAALAVLDILEQGDAYARMEAAGRQLFDGARALAHAAGLGERYTIFGHPNWPAFRFHRPDGTDEPVLRALWIQEVTRRGVLLVATHNISAALDGEAVEQVLHSYAEAFKFTGTVINQGADPTAYLDGPVPTPAFRARA